MIKQKIENELLRLAITPLHHNLPLLVAAQVLSITNQVFSILSGRPVPDHIVQWWKVREGREEVGAGQMTQIWQCTPTHVGGAICFAQPVQGP